MPSLRQKIIDTRTAEGVQVTGSLKKSDMLPDIEAMLANPAGHFTLKLGETIESLRPDSIRASHEDPALPEATALQRRYAPLADALDMERGVKPHVDSHGDVSSCVATATLAAVQNGPTLEEPPAGRITVGSDGPRVAVRTFAADGAVQDLPFNVIVAC